MKVLSIEQMTRLKELGVDVEPNGLDFMYSSVVLDEYRLMYAESVCEDDIKAFTLQDVIELLPKVIKKDGLHLYFNIKTTYSGWYSAEYSFYQHSQFDLSFTRENILDAAYEMLIWVIENGHLKTK